MPPVIAALASTFGALDWAVVLGVLAATTAVGWIVGKRGSIREYFLGGRTLPWWAVSASIAATEISALTLVSLPAVVFRPGGNLAYLQIALVGNVVARLLVAWWLVPAWFEREIYSPYDHVGAKLGARARATCSALFAFGALLAQGARLYLSAIVLELLLHDDLARLAATTHVSPIALAIAITAGFAVLWTWIGGMRSVVWTDVVLLLVFTAAAVIALVAVVNGLDKGVERLLQIGRDAHKLDVLDFDRSPAKAYTFWAASIAASFGGIGAYGMDQLMAQRVFCCGSVRAARKAIAASSVAVLVTVLVAFVGVGLFAFYERRPLSGDALALYDANPDRILPIFVLENVASPWKGLVVAGIFAAAVSTLTGALTALAQTAMANVWDPIADRRPWSERDDPTHERRRVRAARVFVLVSGTALAVGALAMKHASARYSSVLDLGLAMAGFTQGALLAAFVLAYRSDGRRGADARRGSGRIASGFAWSAPLSVLGVFALAWHGEGPALACRVGAALFLACWVAFRVLPSARAGVERAALVRASAWLVLGLVLVLWANEHALFPVATSKHAAPEYALLPLSWPWYVPAGSLIAFVFGLLLAPSTPSSTAARAASAARPSMQRITSLLFAFVASAAFLLPACDANRSLRLPSVIPRGHSVERAMWVTRFDYKTAHDIETIAESCKLAGMNTILFQVRGNATASYRSAYEPWSEQFGFADPSFDPLATAIEAAHSRGLELKAWVNVMPAWWGTAPPTDTRQLWNAHKDWLWYDQNGKAQPLSDKFYVSVNPCLPEVRKYLASVMRDLVQRYDLDGLHLDYIRFPNDKAEKGVDYPRDAKTVKLFRGETNKLPDQDPDAWNDWRAEQVSNLLREIRRQVRQAKPDLELSAAVGPEPERALVHHFQDVRTWVKEELVDVLYPMSYAHDTATFQKRVALWRPIADDVSVVMGLRIDTNDVELHRKEIVSALSEFRGFSLFAYSSLFDSANDEIDSQTDDSRAARLKRRTALLPMLKDVAKNGGMSRAE